ncbi:MAG: PEP-CTERM sorting domain-containing protein [Desmonostoc vinosum HA7617-LM4]|jgi:hypothetical protein|nr:PEP-CTERM sorting domain-containing protein [Desmonostoc vinosum HA7617-LM4]
MTKFSISVTSRFLVFGLATGAMGLMSAQSATAATIDLAFTKLPGLTGGNPARTAVYRADLSGVNFNSINSISITDSGSGTGGSDGKFSGFDLDGIKLSKTLIKNAADINNIAGLNVFDFSPTGTMYIPGTQRSTGETALFGTSDSNIDDSVATLQNFDANSTTGSNAAGFVSLGDNGKVGFNFTSPVTITGPLYLYFGEVGDNGEVANGQITISDEPIEKAPEPASLFTSLCGFLFLRIYSQVRRSK